MTPEQEKEFEEKLKESLENARIQGLSIGMKTATKVIYDKVVNINRECSKNDLLRVIKDVRSFCETGLGINKETEIK